MTFALLFGFFHTAWPDGFISFKRLHIFGFNLLVGGALILYYTEGTETFSTQVKAYFAIALLYALAAASGWYIPTLILSLPLFGIVEYVRIKRFSLFPKNFFLPGPVSDKFNQAALLCLSIGIVFASLVILNNEYFRLITNEKLTLEVFFLGYSFPGSLITMALMFSFMTERKGRLVTVLKEIGFWSVNLGVIIFFVFIIFGLTTMEMVVAMLLFATVWMLFFLFIATAPKVQQKTFLVSGMVFLLITAMTGIFYILQYFYPAINHYHEYLLVSHVMVSLYGWNLTGLFIIIRWKDFPIQLNSSRAIALHWVIVLILAPLGKYIQLVSAPAMVAFVALLLIVLFGQADHKKESR